MCKVKSLDSVYEPTILPSYEQLKEDKLNYARSFYVQYCNTDPFSGKCLVELSSDHLYVVQNPPAKPLSGRDGFGVWPSVYEDLPSEL